MRHNRRVQSGTQLTDYRKKYRKRRKDISLRQYHIISACIRVHFKNSVRINICCCTCHKETVICIHMCQKRTHYNLAYNKKKRQRKVKRNLIFPFLYTYHILSLLFISNNRYNSRYCQKYCHPTIQYCQNMKGCLQKSQWKCEYLHQ